MEKQKVLKEEFEKDSNDILDNLESTDRPDLNKGDNSMAISVEEVNTIENNTAIKPELTEEGITYEIGELSDNEQKEVVLKEEDDGKIFRISYSKINEPILKDENGNPIPPKPFKEKGGKVGYKTKLKLLYEDTNYVSYIPNIKWYPGINKQTNKPMLSPWFPIDITEEDLTNQFTPEVSKLYFKFCKFIGVEPGKLTRKDFELQLNGKLAKVKQTKQKRIDGTLGYRIDIEEFVEEKQVFN